MMFGKSLSTDYADYTDLEKELATKKHKRLKKCLIQDRLE